MSEAAGWQRRYMVISMACLTAMLIVGLYALRNERRVMQIVQAQADQSAGRSSAELAAQLAKDAPAASMLTGRAAMARGIIRLRAAARTVDPARRRQLIAYGFSDAAWAYAAMPHSGGAALTLAYAHVMRDGSASPMALRYFASSYAIHPYLQDAVEWRLRYAVENWARLDPALRAAVVNEGRWFSGLRATNRLHVYVLTGGSPVWPAIAGQGAAPDRSLFDHF